MRVRHTAQILLKLTAIAGVNAAIVKTAVDIAQRDHQAFLEMPREKQRQLYNECPLQKMGTSNDAFAALQEAVLLHDPRQKSMPTIKPFDEAYPETSVTKLKS
ncbi:MAG TPA: hypothetical protein VL360_02970 [Gammaproteobacteria bacterium]|jgi:hypothetical protein|nr:hypothetical protein [Gammaproteobacteria bacterium]